MQEFNEKYAWVTVEGFQKDLRIVWSDTDDKEIDESTYWQVFDYRDQQDGKLKSIYFPTFPSAIKYIRYGE